MSFCLGPITLVLELQPVPGLAAIWSAFQLLWEATEEQHHAKQQLVALAESVAELLHTLHKRAQDISPGLDIIRLEEELDGLQMLLVEITAWIGKQNSKNFLKSLFQAESMNATLDTYHKRLLISINRFNISSLGSISDHQEKFEAARRKDQQALNVRLVEMQRDTKKLAKMLETQQSSMMAMMVSIQRALQTHEGTGSIEERQFLKSSFNYLASASGKTPIVEPWTISPFDVEFEERIGGGGFGEVHRGIWDGCPVALKVLKQDGVLARESAIRREVKVWETLRHPNLLQFLGANILDEPPFIVMPYFKNGNAKDYIMDHPEFDRGRILLQASRGLVYLHNHKVIHGDLKAMNILIDDGYNAVLADFGLSRLRSDVSTRLTGSGQPMDGSNPSSPGSYYWMAPERLQGGTLQAASDIYSFAMTIYEIFTTEIPLGHYPISDLRNAVIHQGLRPMRPDDSGDGYAVAMSDDLWNLCMQSWDGDPKARPTASFVCNSLNTIFASDPLFSPLQDQNILRSLSPITESPTPFTNGALLMDSPTLGIEHRFDFNLGGPLPSPSLLVNPDTPPFHRASSSCSSVSPTFPSPENRRLSALSDASLDRVIGLPSAKPESSQEEQPPKSGRDRASSRIEPKSPKQTLTNNLELSRAYAAEGQFKEALALVHQVIQGRKHVLGKDHADTLDARRTLFTTLYSAGQLKEACTTGDQLVKDYRRVIGDEDAGTRKCIADLAELYQEMRKWPEAMAMGKKLIELQTAAMGVEDKDRLDYILSLGLVYRSQKKYKEAEKLQLYVVDMRKKVLGEEHLDTLRSMAALAGTYSDQADRLPQAAQLKEKVYETRNRLLGPEDPQTMKSMASLAITYYNQDRFEEAAELEEKVVELRKSLLGSKHPDTLQAADQLSRTYFHLGKLKSSAGLRLESMNIFSKKGSGSKKTRKESSW